MRKLDKPTQDRTVPNYSWYEIAVYADYLFTAADNARLRHGANARMSMPDIETFLLMHIAKSRPPEAAKEQGE